MPGASTDGRYTVAPSVHGTWSSRTRNRSANALSPSGRDTDATSRYPEVPSTVFTLHADARSIHVLCARVVDWPDVRRDTTKRYSSLVSATCWAAATYFLFLSSDYEKAQRLLVEVCHYHLSTTNEFQFQTASNVRCTPCPGPTPTRYT